MKRNHIQYLFLLFNVYIGFLFFLFVRSFQTGATTASNRPPSVEAYLPIAALISLKHLVVNGVFDPVHPAALAIFIAVLFSAVLFRRGFCSWICPVGAVSEAAHKLGGKAAINLKPPGFIDLPLRAVKYLLLAFFAFAVAGMDGPALQAFVDSPFHKIADVRMLLFFLSPSRVTIIVLASFFLLSLVVKNFWCRYLCPYGALLGILAKAGLVSVRRDVGKCIDCRKCEESCPAYINITGKTKVASMECIMCAECVNACAQTKALSLSGPGLKKMLKPRVYGLLLVGSFLAIILLAQATGRWRTNISPVEYRQRIPEATAPEYSHP